MGRRRQPNGTAAAEIPYPTQPIQAPVNQPYGERKATMDAQRAVPLADLRASPATPQVDEARHTQEIEAFDPFSGITPMNAPSRYPNEPVTTGLRSGPGAGPEALLPRPRARMVDALMALAEATGDPEIKAMAMESMTR